MGGAGLSTPPTSPRPILARGRISLDAAGIVGGPPFRNRHDKLGGRLSDRAVALVVKRAATSIGAEASAFAGHSLRAGFATSAARAGRHDRDITHHTGHKSRAVFDRYVRAAHLWNDNPAAGLL